MIAFLLKVWSLAKPYRGRLLLGVLTGVVGGLIEPLMIATITMVYSVVFPSANSLNLSERLKWAPTFVQDWAEAAQAYFDCMRPQFGANTREKLEKYDEALFKLVDEVYKQSKFRYVRYDQRKPKPENGSPEKPEPRP